MFISEFDQQTRAVGHLSLMWICRGLVTSVGKCLGVEKSCNCSSAIESYVKNEASEIPTKYAVYLPRPPFLNIGKPIVHRDTPPHKTALVLETWVLGSTSSQAFKCAGQISHYKLCVGIWESHFFAYSMSTFSDWLHSTCTL